MPRFTPNDFCALHGGSWKYDTPDFFRCADNFDFFNPDYRFESLGFRCTIPLDSRTITRLERIK